MTLTFLEPGVGSEGLIDIPESTEQAPYIAPEPMGEKVRKALAKSTCPICGAEMTEARIGIHMRAKHKDSPSGEEKSPSAERKPKTDEGKSSPRRVKADDILSLVASGAGSLLAASGVSVPTGMALRLEAPLLGPELDKAVAQIQTIDATTFEVPKQVLDRILQNPMAAASKAREGICPGVAS